KRAATSGGGPGNRRPPSSRTAASSPPGTRHRLRTLPMPAPMKRLKVVEAPAPTTSDVTITPVQSAADREAFIRFPYTLYADDPNWVPPLEMERRDFLDPKKNPWFEF